MQFFKKKTLKYLILVQVWVMWSGVGILGMEVRSKMGKNLLFLV
jgi:hypothetical protein